MFRVDALLEEEVEDIYLGEAAAATSSPRQTPSTAPTTHSVGVQTDIGGDVSNTLLIQRPFKNVPPNTTPLAVAPRQSRPQSPPQAAARAPSPPRAGARAPRSSGRGAVASRPLHRATVERLEAAAPVHLELDINSPQGAGGMVTPQRRRSHIVFEHTEPPTSPLWYSTSWSSPEVGEGSPEW